MINPSITTEEQFDTLKPLKNHLDDNANFNGLLYETFGAELDYVNQQPNDKIWTYIDADGVLVLSNGYHTVNRVGYIITELPYHGPDTEVVLWDEDDEREMAEETTEEYNPLINEG